MPIKDIDLGWKRIKKELKALDGSYTQIGIQNDAGDEKNGSFLVDVGVYNEYGTENKDGSVQIPARPFMRTAFDESKIELKALKRRLYNEMLVGKITAKKALGILGEFMEGKTKKKITDIRTPANADSTKAAKGSSNPLIDTGRLRASIRHVEVMSKR